MELAPATRERIEGLVRAHPVVLFMKGTRQGPQCGFSATVVGILDRLVPDYRTVDVLADPEIRDGIKTYSSWPTIPQLYVGGEFLGGCDIIQEMFASGELHDSFGIPRTGAGSPTLVITDAAAAALRQLAENAAGRDLHLGVDARFQTGLYFGPPEAGEIRVEANGITIAMDPLTASRADGVAIDARETQEGPAFQVDNPNAPRVQPLAASRLKEMLEARDPFELVDVRTPEECEKAAIPGARLLDEKLHGELEALDRATTLVFHCHHGGRSQRAAEHFAGLGFRSVYNLTGGIDAWSQEVDPSVPRY
jgi:monothiol glutaredoxin